MTNYHSPPKNHVNPRYDPNKDSKVDVSQQDTDHINPRYDPNSDGVAENVAVDLTPIKTLQLNMINDIAKNNYKNSLIQNNYDDVFFDVFANQEKISSSSTVTTTIGENGEITLIPTFGTTATRAVDGATSNTTDATGLRINPNSALGGIKIEISSNTGTVSEVGIADGSGNRLVSKTGNFSAGSIITLYASLSAGTDYYAYIYNGGDSYTFGRVVAGSFDTSTDIDITYSAEYILTGAEGKSDPYSILSVTAITNFNLSGQITSTTKSLSFTPSKIIVQQDAIIPADEDIVYELYDSSSTLITTIDQTEVGSEVLISTTDTSFYVVPKLSSSDGADTPQLNEYGVMFV